MGLYILRIIQIMRVATVRLGHWTAVFTFISQLITEGYCFSSCSSADETEDGELDPDIKAQREKERRQANNARERCAFT